MNIELHQLEDVQHEVEIQNEVEHNPSDANGMNIPTPSTSGPRKLKGSLSIKFKSYNWAKGAMKSKSGEQTFDEDEDVQEEDEEEELLKEEGVIISQDNQPLKKCLDCLLYVPLEKFELHVQEECEALHLTGGREYICSECLASYSSQKFLVRHKRECPKRNQNLSLQSRYPKTVFNAMVDDMYSVVWKCHCKRNFSSAEELSAHRDNCISAQQYSTTCPICNTRLMGGSRTLRYHMTQNHASLFMPEETNSSSVLSGLQGTSPPVQVITTQTSNINALVRRLSKEHAGANIRVVSVDPEKYKSEQEAQAAIQKQIEHHIHKGEVVEEEKVSEEMLLETDVQRAARETEEAVAGIQQSTPEVRKRKGASGDDEIETETVGEKPIEKRTKVTLGGRGLSKAEDLQIRSPRSRGSDSGGESPRTRSVCVQPETPPRQQTLANSKAGNSMSPKGHQKQTEGFLQEGERLKDNTDLQNLLVKAKALTKELEEKLSKSDDKSAPKKKKVPTATLR